VGELDREDYKPIRYPGFKRILSDFLGHRTDFVGLVLDEAMGWVCSLD
jgi:hypothetical protein